MSSKNLMAVLLNGVAQLEYDRSKPLTDFQSDYLNNMDAKMDGGIFVGEELIKNPDVMARVKFVTGNLLHSIKGNDEETTAAFCSYIATRMTDIKQIKIRDLEEISIELVFDQEYRQQKTIPITMLDS